MLLQDLRVLNSQAATKCPWPWGGRGSKDKARDPRDRTPAWLEDTALPDWAAGPRQGVLGSRWPLCWLYFLPRTVPSPPGSLSSPVRAPSLLGCFLPLYRVLQGIRKGSASSSWRQEGACSQGHLVLSGEGGRHVPAQSPVQSQRASRGQEGAGPFPKPSTSSNSKPGADKTQGSPRGSTRPLQPRLQPPTPPLNSPWPRASWTTDLMNLFSKLQAPPFFPNPSSCLGALL